MLKQAKQATLTAAKSAGILNMVQHSNWRRHRLLILGYHGISMSDEHLWNGSHFLSEERFYERLKLLKSTGCTVLPLREGLERMYANDLPERSTVITFDDGTIDFYKKAFPLLREFGYPVTLYLTTFYLHYRKPVFDLMCSYLLWKGRTGTLDLRKMTGLNVQIGLGTGPARDSAFSAIRTHALERNLSADDKDELLRSMAIKLNIDYDELLDNQALQILTRRQVKDLSANGVDVQLHAHRHRTPNDRRLFIREITENRGSIRALTGRRPTHFCYPNGHYQSEFLPWLKEAGVVSATTCNVGLASADANRFLLPRVLDVSSLSAIEFEGWLTGISAALPRRAAAGRA